MGLLFQKPGSLKATNSIVQAVRLIGDLFPKETAGSYQAGVGFPKASQTQAPKPGLSEVEAKGVGVLREGHGARKQAMSLKDRRRGDQPRGWQGSCIGVWVPSKNRCHVVICVPWV